MRITNELNKRLGSKFRLFECEDCEGWAVVGQSPSFPEGSPCERCSGTGFTDDGSHLNDLKTTIKNVIEDYIKEFSS